MGRVRPYLIAALVMVAGCVPTLPALSLVERSGLGASLALSVAGNAPAPAPSPGPSPTPSGDVCDECQGVGRLGDGTVMVTCPVCNGTGKKTAAEPQAFAPPPAPVRMSGTRWTVAGKRNYTTEELAGHLQRTHGVDPTGYTREELQTLHDNSHNGYSAMGSPKAAASRSSCPNGRCPTR